VKSKEQKREVFETRVIGGSCSYETLKGKYKIISVSIRNPNFQSTGRPEITIKYYFIPDKPIPNKIGQLREGTLEKMTGKEQVVVFPLQPNTEIKKIGLEAGAVLDCEYDFLSSGTCTPKVVRLFDIDHNILYEGINRDILMV